MNLKVGDKVRIKDNIRECKHGYNVFTLSCKGEIGTITSINGDIILLDVDSNAWCWSENVLELINDVKMKRIDYILNAKDNIQAILDETVLDCGLCPGYCKDRKDRKDCDGDCEFYYKKYLNEEIEVDKSKLKLVEEVKRDEEVINEFMEEYEKIVNETVKLCKRKNADYGNATDESFKQFGDVSYQVRCFDKWSRINTLLKNRKAEVSESLEDSLLDLSNYLFLWVTSRRLKEK